MLHNCESDNELTRDCSNVTGPRQRLLDNEDRWHHDPYNRGELLAQRHSFTSYKTYIF